MELLSRRRPRNDAAASATDPKLAKSQNLQSTQNSANSRRCKLAAAVTNARKPLETLWCSRMHQLRCMELHVGRRWPRWQHRARGIPQCQRWASVSIGHHRRLPSAIAAAAGYISSNRPFPHIITPPASPCNWAPRPPPRPEHVMRQVVPIRRAESDGDPKAPRRNCPRPRTAVEMPRVAEMPPE